MTTAKPGYDFAGWVTKHDTLCTDGLTIKHDAFKGDHGRTVPLVWSHNHSVPSNILGHVKLENRNTGVYGYGFFNDSPDSQHAKEMLRHGDISSLSIGARELKKRGNDVLHGKIYEVSLVMAGANPGAYIETVITHEDGGDPYEGDVTIYTGNLIHSSDDVIFDELEHEESSNEGGEEGSKSNNDSDESKEGEDTTIGDVLDTLNETQQEAVYALLGTIAESILEGDDEVKQNVFESDNPETTLTHEDLNTVLKHAIDNNTTLKHSLKVFSEDLEHAATYGVKNIEVLFPEATATTKTPTFYKDRGTGYKEILNATNKSPFQKVKMWLADLTEDEARARGYVTGAQKFDQVFAVFQREASPQTVYKRQKLDRDDIIDVEDFDVVAWIQSEMREQLEEEIARAILVGDGRELISPDKIKEDKIIPIINDHDFFTIKKTITSDEDFLQDVIDAMVEYKGSGSPTLYIDPYIIGRLKLLKAADGRYLYGNMPATEEQLASLMGVSAIKPTTFMLGKGALIVNLADYTIGSAKGGEITNFDDFDIDFNQYKYLIETRLSGALTVPFSAIHLAEADSTSPERVLPHAKDFFNADRKGMNPDYGVDEGGEGGE